MNRQNIVTVIIASSITLSLSYFLINNLLLSPSKKTEKVTRPVAVSSDLATPDPEVFNPSAVNPTIEVYIGSCVDSNQNGFLEPIEKLECAAPDSKKSNPTKPKTDNKNPSTQPITPSPENSNNNLKTE